jgi:hypothetical protein
MVVNGPSLPTLPKAPSSGVEAPIANRQPAAAAAPNEGAAEQSLWGVLTAEERAFFTQQAELGALTYGPKGARTDHLEPPKGQRLDVRI